MKKISDSSFRKIIELRKYKDLYDFSSIECRAALLIMMVLDIIFLISVKLLDPESIVSDYISYLDNIGMALIGFLGFIVTGLAILTGAISSTIVKKLQDRNKIQALERILLSFYLLGLISACIIIFTFIFHFLKILPIKTIWKLDVVLLSIMSYFTVFSIFYAVKLIGNCLELFYIVSNMQIIDDKKRNNITDLKSKYNNYRITALEKIILGNSTKEKFIEYANVIRELIESDAISNEEQEIYLEMYKKQFRINE